MEKFILNKIKVLVKSDLVFTRHRLEHRRQQVQKPDATVSVFGKVHSGGLAWETMGNEAEEHHQSQPWAPSRHQQHPGNTDTQTILGTIQALVGKHQKNALGKTSASPAESS